MRKDRGFIVLVIISIIALISLGGFLIYNSFFKKETPLEKHKVIDTDEEEVSLISKLDENKEWIYDAEYEHNVNTESFVAGSKTFFAKDIIVPFINIDSKYAKEANNNIKQLFDDAIQVYNGSANGEAKYVDECSYKKYIGTDLISTVITYKVSENNIVSSQYYVYNLKLKDGSIVPYDETYSLAGFTTDNIEEKVSESITNYISELEKTNNNQSTVNIDELIKKNIESYKNDITNNTLKYFVSENGKLNIIIKLYTPQEIEPIETIIEIS